MARDIKKLGILMWLTVVTYYLYQYILRVSPSIMQDDIMTAFKLDADGFGSLAAVATFFYAILQIPGGILSDLFGTRRMVLISILMCTIGVGLFAYTDNLYVAYLSRILIGSGSACAFLCISKISSEWFSPDKKSLMFALTVTVGTFGALLGQKPLAILINTYGWRESFYILTAMGVAVLLLNYFLLRNKSELKGHEVTINQASTWATIKEVFTSHFCWMHALVAVGIYLSIAVFADVWGVAFLMLKYEISKEVAAQAVSMIYVGTCVGVIVVAAISRFFADHRPIIAVCSLLLATSLSLIIFGNISSIWGIYFILFSIGFLAGSEVLCFSNTCAAMPISVAGTITGFINFIVTLGAAGAQKQIGYILNVLWDKTLGENGLPLYTIQDYQGAMSLIILATLGSFILSFFLTKEPKKEFGRSLASF